MSDSGRANKPTAADQSSTTADPQQPSLLPRKTGLFGASRMDAVNAERQEVAASLDRRMAAMRKASGAAGEAKIPQSSGGSSLPEGVRARMEPRLGADLSGVKVHTSGSSAEAAGQLGARAFTVGNDVHFNNGEFAPGSKEGDKLIAHELTHVVQGQKSGIQRKPEPGAEGAEGGGEHAHGGGEVSNPDEPAELEADAVSEKVAGDLHGEKKGGAEGGAAGGEHGAAGGEHKGGGGGEHKGAGGGGEHKAEGGAGGGHGAAGGGQGAAQPKAQPAPIAAKFYGAGTRIHRAPAKGAPAPAGAAPAGAAPAAAGSAAKGPAGAAPADPKQAQIEKAKACKSEADVDAFCAADPVATQKLADVKAEVNLENGTSAAARAAYYGKLATWIQTNAESLNPKTIFNQCMNTLAADWRFKGSKLDVAKLPNALQRTQGVKGFWYTAIDQSAYKAAAVGAKDPASFAYNLWLKDAKDGNPLLHKGSGMITPEKGTWFTPDSYKLKNASDAGYGQLLELAALQPEWFPDGNIAFEVDMSKAAGAMEARRPTAYDGMQSSLWVSRPTGEAYGVTGGGANEFLAGKVSASAIKSAKAVIPNADTMTEIRNAIQAARDEALNNDPDLKARLDKEKDPNAKKDLEAMIPNLTDMYMRGGLTAPLGPKIKEMLAAIKTSTNNERANPSATRAPGEITAPSDKKQPNAGAPLGAATGTATATTTGTGGGAAAPGATATAAATSTTTGTKPKA